MNYKEYLSDHGPAICTAFGVVSMLAGAILAVKETPTAMRRIDEADISENASKKDKVVGTIKATWKCYLPALACETAGMALIFGGAKTYSRRYADLSNVLYISEAAYRNLSDRAEKMDSKLTKKQRQEVREEVAEDRVKNNPPENNEVIITGKGEHMFHDVMTGHYFRSSIEEVHKVVNETNAKINREYYVQCNEFITALGEPPNKTHVSLYWGPGEQIELKEDYICVNGEPITVIEWNLPDH